MFSNSTFPYHFGKLNTPASTSFDTYVGKLLGVYQFLSHIKYPFNIPMSVCWEIHNLLDTFLLVLMIRFLFIPCLPTPNFLLLLLILSPPLLLLVFFRLVSLWVLLWHLLSSSKIRCNLSASFNFAQHFLLLLLLHLQNLWIWFMVFLFNPTTSLSSWVIMSSKITVRRFYSVCCGVHDIGDPVYGVSDPMVDSWLALLGAGVACWYNPNEEPSACPLHHERTARVSLEKVTKKIRIKGKTFGKKQKK